MRGSRVHLAILVAALLLPAALADQAKDKAEKAAEAAEAAEAATECAPRDARKHWRSTCDYVLNSGRCEANKVDYLAFHYCTVVEDHGLPPWVTMLVLVPWAMLLFCAIGQAADVFFAPAVGVISDNLQLSPDVAGATLLAFGNGAADVFTQVAAITGGAKVDLPLALGEAVGSAVFVCTFGLALVILFSPEPVTVLSGPYVRDTFFYLVAVSMTATAILDSNFELHESASLVAWYLAYLVAVFYGDKVFPDSFTLPEPKGDDNAAAATEAELGAGKAAKRKGSDSGEAAAAEAEQEEEYEAEDSLEWLEEQLQPCSGSVLSRALWVFTAPVNALQSLTAPAMEVRTVSKLHACFMATFAPAFTYAVFVLDVKAVTRWDYAIMSAASVACFRLTLWYYPLEGLSPQHSRVLTAVAFLQGIAWMDLCADELVDVLGMLGRVLALPEAFLGATVLAWGASAGDAAALLATAAAGRGAMAISACFAGPLLSLLVGTAGSLAYVGMVKGDIHVQIHDNLPVLFAFAIVLMLLLSAVVPLYFHFRFTRPLAFILMGMFAVYTVLMACTGFGYIALN